MKYCKLNFFVMCLVIFIELGLTHNKTLKVHHHRKRHIGSSSNSTDVTLLSPNVSDYLLRLFPFKKMEPECSSIKKISPPHKSTMIIKSEFKLSNEDLLQCEVIDADYIEKPKSRLDIHTIGSSSDPSSLTKITKLTEDNCFSFRVKSDGVVKIHLFTEFAYKNHAIIVLGSNGNAQSYMIDNNRLCETCEIIDTPDILSSNELKGFWVSWVDHTLSVGKENSKEQLFSNTFTNIIDVPEIKFIGISTEGSHLHSYWTIEEPFCPEVLAKPKEKYFVVTNCQKIFHEKALSFKKLSEEEKLLKKVEAILLEFNVEEPTTAMTSSRIENYYNHNMKSGYFEEYINLFKKCKEEETCDKAILNKIDTTIDELRTKLKNKSKITINEVPKNDERPRQNQDNFSHQRCSPHAHLTVSNKCVCKFGFAGNGQYCNEDSDDDGVPDEAIPECSGMTECSRDNCPYVSNNDQLDANKNGIGDVCEDFRINKENCVNITAYSSGGKCKLQWDFFIPYGYNQNKIELTFSQEYNDNILYKFAWHNNDFPVFELDKLRKYEEDDNFESATSSGLWRVAYNREKFQLGKSYRFIINYENKSLRISVEGLINSDVIYDNDIENYEQINKLCAKSTDITWIRGDHSCE